MAYLVCQHERGGNTHRDHLQGYIELTRSQEMTWVHLNVHPQLALQKRRGTQVQAIDYCTKEDTRINGPWHLGVPVKASGQGARGDIIALRDLIREGANYRELIEEMPATVARYARFVKLVFTYTKPPAIRLDLEVVLLYGSTGRGKTRWVFEHYDHEDLYEIPLSQKSSWFDGYDGESTVLLDDFSGVMPRTQLLRLLDIYRLRVPTKGSFVWWRPIRILITTNVHPRKWYQDWKDFEEHYRALARRIHRIYDWNLGDSLETQEVTREEYFNYSIGTSYHSASVDDRRKVLGYERGSLVSIIPASSDENNLWGHDSYMESPPQPSSPPGSTPFIVRDKGKGRASYLDVSPGT